MDTVKTSAPDKHQPHPFEAGLEIPIGAAATSEVREDAGAIAQPPRDTNCTLCGARRSDQIHVAGKAEADAESPKWG